MPRLPMVRLTVSKAVTGCSNHPRGAAHYPNLAEGARSERVQSQFESEVGHQVMAPDAEVVEAADCNPALTRFESGPALQGEHGQQAAHPVRSGT